MGNQPLEKRSLWIRQPGPEGPPEDGFWGVKRGLSTSLEGTWTLWVDIKRLLKEYENSNLQGEEQVTFVRCTWFSAGGGGDLLYIKIW